MVGREHISIDLVEYNNSGMSEVPCLRFHSISEDFVSENNDVVGSIITHYTTKHNGSEYPDYNLLEIVETLNPIFASEETVFDTYYQIRNNIIDEIIK